MGSLLLNIYKNIQVRRPQKFKRFLPKKNMITGIFNKLIYISFPNSTANAPIKKANLYSAKVDAK